MKPLLNWLLNRLFWSGTMFFAAAPVAVGGVSDGTDSGADHSSGGGVDDAGDDKPGDTQPSADAGTDGATPAGAAQDGTAKPEVKVDGRQLPAKVRELMEALKASDPKAHTFMKDILFADRAFRQEFPGGLAEAKKFKEEVSAFAKEFPDGVQGVRTELSEWRGLDEAYNAADPKAIDVWADTNPQSFAKLMPTAINKFAQMDGDGYQRYMAQVIMSTLQNSGVSGNLRLLDRMLQMKDVEGASGLLKELTGWVGAMDETAKSQPKPAQVDPTQDKRGSELDDREAKIWASETAGQINPFRSKLIRTEAAQYLPKGVALDDETFEAIDGQVQRYADKVLMADPQFVKQFAAYSEAKDTQGLISFMHSKLSDVLKSLPGKPGAIEKAVKLFFRGATPAPKPAPNGKPATPAPQGWAKAAKPPAPHEIDSAKTTWEMRFDKQAVLKSGARVFWGDKVPS